MVLMRDSLLRLAARGKHVFWVTTNSHPPIAERFYGQPPTKCVAPCAVCPNPHATTLACNVRVMRRTVPDYLPPPSDWRHDAFLLLYNRISYEVMHPHFPIVNTFDISFPLNELSYDGSHYHDADNVGAAIQAHLASKLCPL
jgi:hypothetical protein